MSQEYDYRVKVILLGDVGVGKSSFVKTLSKQHNIEHGCSCLTYSQNNFVEVECVRNEKKILAKIIDTGGQEKFRSITASYYRGAHGCLFMFNKNVKGTLDSIVGWADQLKCFCPSDIVCTLLVGTSSSHDVISTERAEALADNIGSPYKEIINGNEGQVIKVLHTIIDMIIAYSPKSTSMSVSLTPQKRKPKKPVRSCPC